jgi:hypothetical protein
VTKALPSRLAAEVETACWNVNEPLQRAPFRSTPLLLAGTMKLLVFQLERVQRVNTITVSDVKLSPAGKKMLQNRIT